MSADVLPLPTMASWKTSPWQLAIFGAAIGLRLAGGDIALAGYSLLALYALLGYRHVVQALAISWLLNMINPGLPAEPSPESALGGILVVLASILSAGLRKLPTKRMVLPSVTIATVVLVLFLIINSIVISYQPDVSLLKTLYFSMLFLALLGAWRGLSPVEHASLVEWLYFYLLAVLFVGVPLAFVPLGFLRNGTGFQGVLSHPQAFGVVAGVLTAWVTAKVLSARKPSTFKFLLLVALAAAVVASEARTAGVALLVALVGTLLVYSLDAGKPLKAHAPGLTSSKFWTMALVALLGLAVAWAVVADRMADYVYKRTQAETLVEALDASRGRLTRKMLANIESVPFIGIGFGVASDPLELVVKRDPVFNLPISAAIEKGVMPIAVLEELGVFGASIFVWWVFAVLRQSYRAGFVPLVVSLGILATNIGEYTLFAPSGNGLILLVVLSGMATMRNAARAAV